MSGAVPKLRFPGFAGEWKAAKLSSGVSLVSGQHLGPGEYNHDGVGVPYFTGPSDFTNSLSGVKKWTSIPAKTASHGDMLITVKGSGVGEAMISQLPQVAMGRQLMAIRSNGFLVDFAFQYLTGQREYLQALAAGNMIPGLSRDDILTLSVHFPALPEQEKIAGFLGAVDGKISGLRRKEEGLKRFKAGLMQKLFSQELRFTRDDGSDFPDWEEKRLGDCIDLVSGQHLSPEEYNGDGQGLPYFTGPSDYTNDVSGVTKWTTLRGAKIAKPGDTVITVKGSGVGELLQLRFSDVAMGRQLMAVRAAGTDGRLIFQVLATLRHEFQARAAGNMIPGLSRDDILSLSVELPKHPDEQGKIAAALSALDGKSAGVRTQIAGLETFKKGLLQQMFV